MTTNTICAQCSTQLDEEMNRLLEAGNWMQYTCPKCHADIKDEYTPEWLKANGWNTGLEDDADEEDWDNWLYPEGQND